MLVALLACGSAGAASSAADPPEPILKDVAFAPREDALRFRFEASESLAPEDVEASGSGTLLKLQLDGLRVRRRWIAMDDPLIRRALLQPMLGEGPGAVLRVRLREVLTPALRDAIRVRATDGVLLVEVPRDEAVAAQWAQEARAAAAAEEPAPLGTLPSDSISSEPAPISEAPQALPLPGRAAPAEGQSAAQRADEPIGPVASIGLGQAGAGPGVGPWLVALGLLAVVGFVIGRRLRSGAPGTGGPLIRPVASHALGPRHRLLLVDVAGQLILLGTSDKGLQMLSEIERPADLAALAEAPEAAPKGSLARRFGGALVRAGSRLRGHPSLDDLCDDDLCDNTLERDFFARADDLGTEDLHGLVDASEPVVRLRSPVRGPRRARRRSAPRDDTAAGDILSKIRALQGA